MTVFLTEDKYTSETAQESSEYSLGLPNPLGNWQKVGEDFLGDVQSQLCSAISGNSVI